MTRVRVKGIKRYRSKGRWYVYHRKSGKRIDAEFGTGAFFNELATLERRMKREAALPVRLVGCSPPTAHLAPISIWRRQRVPDICV